MHKKSLGLPSLWPVQSRTATEEEVTVSVDRDGFMESFFRRVGIATTLLCPWGCCTTSWTACGHEYWCVVALFRWKKLEDSLKGFLTKLRRWGRYTAWLCLRPTQMTVSMCVLKFHCRHTVVNGSFVRSRMLLISPIFQKRLVKILVVMSSRCFFCSTNSPNPKRLLLKWLGNYIKISWQQIDWVLGWIFDSLGK